MRDFFCNTISNEHSLACSIRKQIEESRVFDLYFYDQLANSSEQYHLTISPTEHKIPKPIKPSKPVKTHTFLTDSDSEGEVEGEDKEDEDELIPPLEDAIATRWPDRSCDWNGSEPLL